MGSSTCVVDGALELDSNLCLGGGRQLLVKGEGSTLVLLIVRDVGGLDGLLGLGVLGHDGSLVNLQLVSIEHDFLGGVANLGGDGDGALVAESAAKLQIVQRDGIVGGLDTGRWLRRGCGDGGRGASHVSGRTSLSEAMAARIHESVLQERVNGDSGGNTRAS